MKVEVAKVDDISPTSAVKRERRVDALGRAYGTGRRKESVARVWVKPGSGKITVNNREFENYFPRSVLRMIILQAFEVTNSVGHFDVYCTVKGGGLTGQAGALRHGISNALQNFDPTMRPSLKSAGMLTRDSRTVERKKYGRMKARRRYQFSKR